VANVWRNATQPQRGLVLLGLGDVLDRRGQAAIRVEERIPRRKGAFMDAAAAHLEAFERTRADDADLPAVSDLRKQHGDAEGRRMGEIPGLSGVESGDVLRTDAGDGAVHRVVSALLAATVDVEAHALVIEHEEVVPGLGDEGDAHEEVLDLTPSKQAAGLVEVRKNAAVFGDQTVSRGDPGHSAGGREIQHGARRVHARACSSARWAPVRRLVRVVLSGGGSAEVS